MDGDLKAKERTLAQSGLGVQLTPPSRENAEEAVARLDERIAEQRKDSKGATDSDSKLRARESLSISSSMRREPRSGLRELKKMEAEVAAKANARTQATQPGTPRRVSQTSARKQRDIGRSSFGRSTLDELERDVISKSQALSVNPNQTPGAYPVDTRSEIAGMTAKIAEKNCQSVFETPGRPNDLTEDGVAAKYSVAETPGACQRVSSCRTDLSRLESEAAAKNMVRSIPGVQELRSMEDAVARKCRVVSTGQARNEIDQLGGLDTTKQVYKELWRPGATSLRDLEERIVQKTGTVVDSGEDEGNQGDHRRPCIENSVTKLTTDIVDPSLEKLQALQTSNVLSEFEIKMDCTRQYQPSDDSVGGATSHSDVETPDEELDRLAVAVAVSQDEDDAFIPAAVEYDPDAKPPIYKNRRFRLYGLLACTLLFVVTAGVLGILAKDRKQDTFVEEPSQAPTSARYKLGIQEELELVVGSEKLNDPSSPHFRAKQWIIKDDPMQLSTDDPNLRQRFLLALFYFQTHEEGEWLSCNAPDENSPEDECTFQKLVAVYPKVYRETQWIKWLSSSDECNWAGIFCDEFNQVRVIDLTGQEISGTLPVEITYLRFLQNIALSWNLFYGTIPSELAEIKHLLALEIHYNLLTGTLPGDWSKAVNLQVLNVGANHLTGTLPLGLRHLSGIKGFFIFDNFFTGTWHAEFAEMSLLVYIRIQQNNLFGTLPSELGILNTKEFWFHANPFSGTIPAELGNMRAGDFRLSSTNLHGTIPEELYNIKDVWTFDLYGTNLTGTLSSKVGQLSDLAILRIQDNHLSGEIPKELAQLINLKNLRLEGNDFTGVVPSGLCTLKSVSGLEVISADCLPSVETGLSSVTCGCCDMCCENSGQCTVDSNTTHRG